MNVYNRSADKAKRWTEKHPGKAFATAAEAADGCEIVALCVGNDADVRAVLEDVLPVMAKDAIVLDHTTASAKLAREASEKAEALGRFFIDAPVSGGQAGAENGTLSVMAGGDEAAFERAVPFMGAYAKAIRRIGSSGAGQLTKMVNQICIAGVLQGLSEGLAFAQKAELDVDAVLQAISKGAAQSWQMGNRWKTMAQGKYDFGFAVDWMRKDLGLTLDEARANGSSLQLTALVDQFYAEVQQMGGRRWDTSSLVARLNR